MRYVYVTRPAPYPGCPYNVVTMGLILDPWVLPIDEEFRKRWGEVCQAVSDVTAFAIPTPGPFDDWSGSVFFSDFSAIGHPTVVWPIARRLSHEIKERVATWLATKS